MKVAQALRVALGPSRLAVALTCFACLTTAALVAWLPGTPFVRGALVVGIGAYAVLTLRRWGTRSALRAIVGIELDADRAACLTERAGHRIQGVVQADSYVGPWVTTVVVLPDGKRRLRTVAILPDMLPADDFRRLRLLLRLGRAASATVDP